MHILFFNKFHVYDGESQRMHFFLLLITSLSNDGFAENGINDKVCVCVDWVPYFCYIA